jgi:glycopeptide antibiotics resistance protein
VTRQRLIVGTFFGVYALSVLAITVIPHPRPHLPWQPPWWAMIELTPFDVEPVSMVANIIMFVPFGALVPLLWRWTRPVGRLTALAFGTSLAIELTQLLFLVLLNSRRTVDINDLIANTGGALLGLGLLRLIMGSVREKSAGPVLPIKRVRGEVQSEADVGREAP